MISRYMTARRGRISNVEREERNKNWSTYFLKGARDKNGKPITVDDAWKLKLAGVNPGELSEETAVALAEGELNKAARSFSLQEVKGLLQGKAEKEAAALNEKTAAGDAEAIKAVEEEEEEGGGCAASGGKKWPEQETVGGRFSKPLEGSCVWSGKNSRWF